MVTATPAVCPSHAALVAVIRAKTNGYVNLYDEKCGTDGIRRAILVNRNKSYSVTFSPTKFTATRL